MLRRLTVLVVAAGVLLGSAAAQQPADEAQIRARLAAYADARTRRDAKAEALCYTETGDFRSSAGPFVTGRAAIEQQLTVNNPAYRFVLDVVKLRFITPDVAIVEADVSAGVGDNLGRLIGTYVLLKQGNDWLIDAARISRPPAPPPAR